VTYSIVARDPATGELGVAVQSHWFSVGPIVPWARPGVGAVATQANAEPAYGPRALDLIAAGASAHEALRALLDGDPLAESRQVAVLDAAGSVAVHTGSECIAHAGHAASDGVSCQANIMASPTVWPAMLDAYRAAEGPLADRLLEALRAAEAQGGDLRGRQSSAILVVPAAGESWRTSCSLRVEDHPEPLAELERLVALDRAYRIAAEGDELLAAGRAQEAAARFVRALSAGADLGQGAAELRFWAGLGLVHTGELERGARLVAQALQEHAALALLLERLPAGMASAAAAVRERLR